MKSIQLNSSFTKSKLTLDDCYGLVGKMVLAAANEAETAENIA